ncbi:MAG: chitobiase/beta-hexosaminidase C-terminal domain-containing protein [Bacteroidaceae bacterium]|nr:chitobiase/beta-hexosaminidase C-terminal domain-containing protein [Bacteroidaceae bacterium]
MNKKITLLLLALLVSVLPTSANDSNKKYFFKTTVTASGAGKVYASTSKDSTPEYQENIVVEPESQEATSAPTVDIYLWAAPETGKEVRWTTEDSNITITVDSLEQNRAIASVTGLTESADNHITANFVNQQVKAPLIEGADGKTIFWPSLQVTITAQEGATIYYTLDGSDPTTTSPVYTEPITLTDTTTVKAYATAEGWVDSEVSVDSFYLVKPEGFITLGATSASAFIGTEGTVPVIETSHPGLVWTSSDPEIVEVEAETGVYKALALGEATLTATLAEGTDFTAATATFRVRVITPKYQVENSDFEQWDDAGTANQEPAHWNSFQHASGKMADIVKAQQVVQSEDVRPGSEGTASVCIYARSVMGLATAQGNLTTGCINGGSMSASDGSGNYNYSNVDDPDFHQVFNGLPDSLRVWVKYQPGDASTKGKVSAKLHTYGYYQDPYANLDKIGQTQNVARVEIAVDATGDEWVELTVPVEYDITDGTRPGVALISLATCNVPGGGSSSDKMFVDDLSFVYNSELTAVVVKGDTLSVAGNSLQVDAEYDAELVEFVTNARAASVESSYDEDTAVLTVTVKGDDISEETENQHVYTIQFSLSTGIAATSRPSTTTIYDLTGRKVQQMQRGGIYIIGGKKVIR